MLSAAIELLTRCLLVGLFLPFSALDKILNFSAAVDQAVRACRSRAFAIVLISGGLFIELAMSLAILTGIADRLAALILAVYCMITALLWKKFWADPDFRLKGPSKGRDVFWDFMKNFALAGGFLILALGADAVGIQQFMHDPLASSHPYSQVREDTK